MARLTEVQKITIATLLAGAFGASAVALLPEGERVVDPGAPKGEVAAPPRAEPAPKPKGDDVDVEAYTAAIAPARAAAPSLVDLLSAPVDPGAEVTTEVVLPVGARIVGDPTYLGDAAGAFTTLELDHVDQAGGTVVRLRARNDGATRLRLVAMIEVGP